MDLSNCSPPKPDKNKKPSVLVTIDAEGDNLWSKPTNITTKNAKFLPRFQRLCESYGVKPTYLVNYEMVNCPTFQEFGRDMLKRGTGEIGMHLHAWNNPPLDPLTQDDFYFHPYLIEYPEEVMRGKITVLTDLLEDKFGVKMLSHRAGRWGFNQKYARLLVEKGYRIDCSVTPNVSWKNDLGDPNQDGGTDYSKFPNDAYFVDLDEVSRPGASTLLELPVTITPTKHHIIRSIHGALNNFHLAKRGLNAFMPSVFWLRPNGRNRGSLLRVVQQAVNEKRDFIQFVLHSSELMAGGSPTFPKGKDIEVLYEDLDTLFTEVTGTFVGDTLQGYYEKFKEGHQLRHREGF